MLVLPFVVRDAAHRYPDPRRNAAEEWMFVVAGGSDNVITGRRPGAFVSEPIGMPHAFATRTNAPARMLLTCTPLGHERCFAELAEILTRESPPALDEIAALRLPLRHHASVDAEGLP